MSPAADPSTPVRLQGAHVTGCTFCGAPAVGFYALDEGCLCKPGETVQALCAQHVQRSSPHGSFELIGYANGFLAWPFPY